MALEALVSSARNAPVYELRDFSASMSQLAGNVAVKLGTGGIILAFHLFLYQFRLFEIGTGWPQAIALLLAIDFTFYWFHRASHRTRFLWGVHVAHHSSQHMNLGTALRQPWLTPLARVPFFWPLPLLGFDPILTASLGAIATLYGFWTHTELVSRLGVLEWIFVCPAHHRVHHGSNPQYIDKNYANMFIVWDRLFGTFEDESEKVRYGLTNNIESYNPFTIAFHDWSALLRRMRSAASPGEAWSYFYRPPGWRPDSTNAPKSGTASETPA